MNTPSLPNPDFTYPIFQDCNDKVYHGTFSNLSEIKCITFGKQVHGDAIAIIDQKPDEPIPCDAMITQSKGLLIGIKHADCQAAILFDPITNTLAVVHAGWRGLVQNIYGKTIAKLKSSFSVDPRNLLVAIAPSLGPSHSEFIHYKNEFPKQFWPYQEAPFHFNLRKIAELQFSNEGISKENLFIEPTDTFEDIGSCHSYRRNKTEKRMATIAGLLTEPNL